MLTTASEATVDWLKSYYEHVDAMRLDELVLFFAPDARMRFANNEPAIGREAIRAALSGVFASINGISHELTNVWDGDDGLLIFETEVTYLRTDGRSVAVPGSAFSAVENEQFSDQRIYVDLTPVFAIAPAADSSAS